MRAGKVASHSSNFGGHVLDRHLRSKIAAGQALRRRRSHMTISILGVAMVSVAGLLGAGVASGSDHAGRTSSRGPRTMDFRVLKVSGNAQIVWHQADGT